MARRSIAERLAQLDAQRKNLQARMGKQERAKDTRRKILLGAFVLHRLERPDQSEFSKNLRDWLKKELPEFLSRDDDAALFDDLIEQAKTKTSKKNNGGETRQPAS
ncbi:MAG: mobilization protein [Rhodospirillaceae bacterium]|nr:MAG: mobilization protein [Rhodospirillaceae bacterium]